MASSAAGDGRSADFRNADPLLNKRFHIGLTFPGELRQRFVEPVADQLVLHFNNDRNHILYDDYHQGPFARPRLSEVLPLLYQNCDLVVVFLCRLYHEKEWCIMEWDVVKHVIADSFSRHRVMFLWYGPFNNSADLEQLGVLASADGFLHIKGKKPAEIFADIIKRYDSDYPDNEFRKAKNSVDARLPIPPSVAHPSLLPRLEALKGEYLQLENALIERAFRVAFRQAFPSAMLAVVFPPLEPGISWQVLTDYFANPQASDHHSHNSISLLINEFARQLATVAQADPGPVDSVLALLIEADADLGSSFRCSAALHCPQHKDLPVYQKIGAEICQDPVKASVSDLQSFGPIIDALRREARRRIGRRSPLKLDLYVPRSLLDAHWAVDVEVTDDDGDPGPLGDIDYRLRSFDRWKVFNDKQLNWLASKHRHSAEQKDCQALLVNSPSVNDRLLSSIKNSCSVASKVAVIRASAASPNLTDRMKWYKNVLRSCVPLALWWHHRAEVSDRAQGLIQNLFQSLDTAAESDPVELPLELPFNQDPAVLALTRCDEPDFVALYDHPLELESGDSGSPILFLVAEGRNAMTG